LRSPSKDLQSVVHPYAALPDESKQVTGTSLSQPSRFQCIFCPASHQPSRLQVPENGRKMNQVLFMSTFCRHPLKTVAFFKHCCYVEELQGSCIVTCKHQQIKAWLIVTCHMLKFTCVPWYSFCKVSCVVFFLSVDFSSYYCFLNEIKLDFKTPNHAEERDCGDGFSDSSYRDTDYFTNDMVLWIFMGL